jgi:hydroxyacylglutathione hydrolase
MPATAGSSFYQAPTPWLNTCMGDESSRAGFLLERRTVEPFMKNGYVLACPETGQAAYIDPGDEAPLLIDWIRRQNLQLRAIINTHGHLDHISGVSRVKQEWDVPVYLHPQDEAYYKALPQQAQWFGLNYPPAPGVVEHLEDGQELRIGNLRLKVHHTPGHSPGGVCLEVDGHLFCGDLILAGSVGRTDLPGGSYETLLKSIQEKVLPLGDGLILHPGHGPDTTIGQERQFNPFLSGASGLPK